MIIILINFFVFDNFNLVGIGVDFASVRHEILLIQLDYLLLQFFNIIFLQHILAVDLAGVAIGDEVASVPILHIEDDPFVLQEGFMHFDELLAGIIKSFQKLAFGLGLVDILGGLGPFAHLIFLENPQPPALNNTLIMILPQHSFAVVGMQFPAVRIGERILLVISHVLALEL